MNATAGMNAIASMSSSCAVYGVSAPLPDLSSHVLFPALKCCDFWTSMKHYIGDLTDTASDPECTTDEMCTSDTTMILFMQHLKYILNVTVGGDAESAKRDADLSMRLVSGDASGDASGGTGDKVHASTISVANFRHILILAYLGAYVDPSSFHASLGNRDSTVVEKSHAFLSLVYNRTSGTIASLRNGSDTSIIYYDAFLSVTILILMLSVILNYFDKNQAREEREDYELRIKNLEDEIKDLKKGQADVTPQPSMSTTPIPSPAALFNHRAMLSNTRIGTQQFMSKGGGMRKHQ